MPGSQHGTPGEGTGSTTPPAKPAAPLDPLAEFVADTEQLKAAVVVRGVIVGSPSTAFVTINGQEQVLHVGDALLDDFRIISISDTGIVADYTRRQALHKSAFLRL